MDKNEPDLVKQLHREAVQRRREQEVEGRALVESMFREAQVGGRRPDRRSLEEQRRQRQGGHEEEAEPRQDRAESSESIAHHCPGYETAGPIRVMIGAEAARATVRFVSAAPPGGATGTTRAWSTTRGRA